jgi:hypothetical protein
MQDIMTRTNGTTTYKHESGLISTVRIETAGMGTRRIRIANLPPEIPGNSIRAVLNQYGEIHSIQEEKWTQKYRYTEANGLKIVLMKLTKHIQSHATMAGHRALISYEGQSQTCYGCGDTYHMYHACPKRCGVQKRTEIPITNTWAQIVSATAPRSETTNSTSTDKQFVAIPKQPEHTEEARTEIIEKTPLTYQKQNTEATYTTSDKKTKPAADPDFPVPLTNFGTTTTEAQTTTNMNVDDTTQDTTQTDNNETYPRKDTIEHTEQAEYHQDNEPDNIGNTLAKSPTTETLETKNDEQTR